MMFAILSYDVDKKRVNKVRKLAEKYLYPVQRSLFQGYLTDRRLQLLKRELAGVLDPETDRVIIYKSFDESKLQTEEIGYCIEQEMIL